MFVDARYEKVRADGRVVSQGVLVLSGVGAPDGFSFREILGVEVADTESEASYHELFRSLKERGLRGVELVVSEDHEGLKAAVFRHFQGASWQRCQVHYARNLLGMVSANKRKELGADLRAIFAQASREQALGLASAVKMCTASVYKGTSALLTQALLAAHANGVLEHVLADLRAGSPGLVANVERRLASAASKSARYVGEMREIAATQAAAGLAPALFDAMAEVYLALATSEQAQSAPEDLPGDLRLEDVLERLQRRTQN